MDNIFIFGAEYLFVLSLVILFVIVFKRKQDGLLNTIYFILLSFGLTYSLSLLAGVIYFNPRPFVVGEFTPLISHAADNGFPSGHTLLVAAIASVTMYLNKKTSVVLWLIALMVGISRIYLGVHHLVDILGSILIALVSTAIVHTVMRRRIAIIKSQ